MSARITSREARSYDESADESAQVAAMLSPAEWRELHYKVEHLAIRSLP